jgi:TPP-dependent pyruvate/acetoin dehydrogenase alpha subunit
LLEKTMQRKKKPAPAKNPHRHSSRRAHENNGSMKELLPGEKLKELYATMLQCRMVKERVRRMFQQGKLTASSRSRTGREASEVGVMIGLLPDDCMAPRRHDVVTGYGLGCGLMTSAALKQVLASLVQPANRSLTQGFAARNGGPAIIAGESPMAARLNLSTGVAFAYQGRKQPNVVVAFSGDDATALGSWHEAVDFAVTHKLPIVHVVQNDGWTESPDPRLLVAVKDMDNAGQESIPTLAVDGNDVVAVYRVAQECMRRAREGHGPSLIECKTQRWPAPPQRPEQNQPGLGTSPPTGDKSEDPLDRMEAYLKQKGLWSDGWKERLVGSLTKQLDAAEKFADESAAKGAS